MPLVLLACPGGNGRSDSDTMGPGGNNRPLRVGNHELVIVPGAVPEQIAFRLTERNSDYIEVEIHPSRAFQKHCKLTLSYARCKLSGGVDPTKFTIVQINPGTNSIIRTLPSSVDTHAKTVTTDQLDHSSGYAIAGG